MSHFHVVNFISTMYPKGLEIKTTLGSEGLEMSFGIFLCGEQVFTSSTYTCKLGI